MTRFGIDAQVALQLARDGAVVPAAHCLVGPNRLRSDALTAVYRARRRDEIDDDARTLLDGITSMRIRLLGDRVSRAVAWQVAEELGWDDLGPAEYVAVAKLQADAFVTLDAGLARQAQEIVTTVPYQALMEL